MKQYLSMLIADDLFFQIIGFILGRVLEEIIPGPGETARFKTRNTRFWRFVVVQLLNESLLIFVLDS